jgi:hypothetical protein
MTPVQSTATRYRDLLALCPPPPPPAGLVIGQGAPFTALVLALSWPKTRRHHGKAMQTRNAT